MQAKKPIQGNDRTILLYHFPMIIKFTTVDNLHWNSGTSIININTLDLP